MKKLIWIIIALLVIGGIYYAVINKNPYRQPATPVTQEQGTTIEPTLTIGTNATLGNYLTAKNGFTLYAFKQDKPGVSNCTATCAKNWPPYIVSNIPTADSNIPGKLATIKRADGAMQITYNDAPLYFWSKDTKPGDTTGNGFNGMWSVVHP